MRELEIGAPSPPIAVKDVVVAGRRRVGVELEVGREAHRRVGRRVGSRAETQTAFLPSRSPLRGSSRCARDDDEMIVVVAAGVLRDAIERAGIPREALASRGSAELQAELAREREAIAAES